MNQARGYGRMQCGLGFSTSDIARRRGGWLVTARDAESIRVADIALLPEERTGCIRDLQTEAERTVRILRLSVVRMNAAARLYIRLDFRVTRRR